MNKLTSKDFVSAEVTKWMNLRARLNNSYGHNPDWDKAIDIFHSRILTKFFNPIQTIIDSKKFQGEGFAILIAQCSLIEFLAAFRTGLIYNHRIRNYSPKYEYNKSGELYVNFLHSADIFKDIFYVVHPNGTKATDQPFNASDFYGEVRCGLLHEARTKTDWTVNVKKKSKTERIFIVQDGHKKKIYRTILHYRLQHYVKMYCFELKDPPNNIMRRLFARKLDDLFNVPRDPNNFDWWIDK